jgi:hypothetical protein
VSRDTGPSIGLSESSDRASAAQRKQRELRLITAPSRLLAFLLTQPTDAHGITTGINGPKEKPPAARAS